MKDKDNNLLERSSEFDLVYLTKLIWNNRKSVFIIIGVFTILGLFIALFSNKQYTSSTTMVPQITNPSSKLGGLSSLATLAGFNLDMNTSGYNISPILYPKIVSSTSFQLEIMNSKYSFNELEKDVSLYEYYIDHYKPGLFEIIKKYTIDLPGLILSEISGEENVDISEKDSGIIKLTKEQNDIRKIIDDQLSLEVNDKEGFLTLRSSFHQKSLSAQVAEKAQKMLQEYITNIKIEKARAEYSFINERFKEKREEFATAQINLATFRDANKNISSAIVRTEEERLENEYQLAFEVYSELAKQLEQARIKIKEDTPVFSVIEEVVVPIEKSKPKRTLILVILFFFGIIAGIGWVFGKTFTDSFKEKWLNS